MVARRLRLASLAFVCVLAGVSVFASVSARAAVRHDYVSQITEVPAGSGAPLPGPLSGLGPMTVDSGHLWAVDDARGVFHVNEFDAATGAFVSQFPQVSPASHLRAVGLGVAVSHGNVYLGAVDTGEASEEGRLAVLNEAGVLQATWTGAATPRGSFGHYGVSDVAVDRSVSGLASGSVYVLSSSNNVIDAFAPEAAGKEPPVSEPSGGHVSVLEGTCPVEGTTCEPLEVIPFRTPSHVAVDDSTGNVLVRDDIEEEVEGKMVHRSVVDVFEPAALGGFVFLRQIKLPLTLSASTFGVDGVNGEIYVAGQGEVDQFSSTGVLLGRILGEGTPTGDLRSLSSIAVDPVSRHVFVGDQREGGVPRQPSVIDMFGGDLVIPDVATGVASSVTPFGATLNGTVKLDKEGEATCQFVWGTTPEFGQTVLCSKPVTEEESAVQATLSQLEPDTTYYYRLQATNKNGLNPGEPSQDQQFTTPGPGIHEEATSNVASTSATLDARIDPHNAPTTYYFQYGTSNAYGTDVPAPPGVALGSTPGDVEVAQHVQGLLAGTTYHYRVVAVSELAAGVFEQFEGPDRTFTTQTAGAFTLPDGRSWEMVSPPDKHGALIGGIGPEKVIQASVNGDAITYLTDAPTEAEPQGYTNQVQVFSTHDRDGWTSHDISSPNLVATGASVGGIAEYPFFSEDLSLSVVQPLGKFNPSLSGEASEQTAYLRTDYLHGNVNDLCVEGCYRPFITGKPGFANVPSGTVFGEEGLCGVTCGPRFAGATPDLSHAVIESPVALAPGSGVEQVEWFDGKLTAIPITKNTAFPAPGVRHGISNDGSRIISRGSTTRGVEMRDVVKEETVRLDAVQGGTGSEPVAPEFQVASNDGSRVFFTDTQALTEDSGARQDEPDLYECEMVEVAGKLKCDLTDLTPLTGGKRANVQGSVLGASEDGSYVYFVADSILAAGGRRGNCVRSSLNVAETCSDNLYLYHDGQTRFVAVLSGADQQISLFMSGLTARVSPNGRWLAFMSQRELTGYDNRDAVSGKLDMEVYLYDASSGRVVCASCSPTGARPVGVEYKKINTGLTGGFDVWPDDTWLAANIPGWTPYTILEAFYQSHYLSDSGRLFFNSNDALMPEDVNGTEDVYQYEPAGVGDCTAASATFSVHSGGCVGLISSGTSAEESGFLDASRSGADVFFLTAAKLALQDYDVSLDVYDAHECTGASPCLAPVSVSPPACSTGDSCKAAPSPQPPVFGSPSSATFSGAGNVTPPTTISAAKQKSLTRTQKLTRALRACRQKKRGKRRVLCERQARARYSTRRSSRSITKLGRG